MPEPFKPLAIVGVSALFPGSSNAHGFWHDIVIGRDLITDVPPERWLVEDHYDSDPRTPDKTYCKRGSFLGHVDFDPIEFGVPPTSLSATDTCQLLALMVAKRVLDDALKGQFQEIDRDRASVILGVTSGQELFLEVASRLQAPVWVKALREVGITEEKVQEVCARARESYVPWQENTFPGLLGNVVAGRIANRFNLGGTNCVTDAACASSLSALSMAASELQLGHSDLVITGGADTFNDISMFVCFSKTPALSPTGDCRPFSDRADGTVLGEGLAMFALKRLDDAEREGNRIYAIVRGIGSSSDGRSKSIYAPLPEGQAKAMRRAYEMAGYGPETVELVEGHGTGTAAGDAAEVASLRSVFQCGVETKPWCAVGSVKSQIGHTKACAGAAGLFKVTMALQHRVLPGTIKVDRPNPQIDSEQGPFYINTHTRPWISSGDHPRRAALSSFGFGGTNFHVTLEEYKGALQPDRKWTSSSELILVCAETPSGLTAACDKLAKDAANQTLAQLALASQLAYDYRSAQRLALVCESTGDLIRKLKISSGVWGPGVYASTTVADRGKTAFLFPGQGSQYPGMTADVAMAFGDSLEVWDRAFKAASLAFPQPVFSDSIRAVQAERLTATENAQPAIGAASASLLAVLAKLGVKPDCVGGHSFGEITALYAAGAISLETLLSIAGRRGHLMADASLEPGAMLSVQLDAEQTQLKVAEWRVPIAIANQNGPRQTVVSGPLAAIEQAARLFAEAKIGSTRLPVSTAFHSLLMSGAVAPFEQYLAGCEIGKLQIPLYSNLDGGAAPMHSEFVRTRLAQQITMPVRFDEMVERMYDDGIRTFIEPGPGSVLTSLVDAILGERQHSAIALDRRNSPGLLSLWQGLGQMAALGFPLDWASLRSGQEVEVIEVKQPGRFVIPINGGNYGRPYPPAGGAAELPKPVTVQRVPDQIGISKMQPSHSLAVAKPTPNGAGASTDSIQAYKIFQQAVTEAHTNWQANLAQGHDSFVRAMETAYLATVDGGSVAMAAAPAVLYAADAPSAAVHSIEVEPGKRAVIPVQEAVTKPPGSLDLQKLLWSVVAETTGYPAEMLTANMELEADLGIDSIKRVEIFSAIQQRLPHLPDFDPSRIAEFRSLGEIVKELPTSSAHIAEPMQATAVSRDATAIVLGLVAEKTGYPVEMLREDMSLEADLGIDSIKRVEIFSALQDSVPGLPQVDSGALSEVSTIGDIIAFSGSAFVPASGKSIAKADSPVSQTASFTNPKMDLSAVVLGIVAEKTGYPPEMLRQDMSLEADLGIDSIKRVEIFSALQEAVPGVPHLDAAALSQLSTIAEVIGFIGSESNNCKGNGDQQHDAELPATSRRRKVVLAEVPALGHANLDPSDGAVFIRNDGAVAPLLAEILSHQGYELRIVDSIPADAPAIIWISDLYAKEDNIALAVNAAALNVARRVSARFAVSGGVFVTVRSHENPWSGGLSGLAKTAALEWPKVRVKAIDIAMPAATSQEIADSIAFELISGGPELEVTLAGKRRRTPIAIPASIGSDRSGINRDSLIAVSGGARGVTAQCMVQLARQTKCKMLLLGRADTNALEVQESIRAITEAGSLVQYAQVDIRDTEAVSGALARVRQTWGPFSGIVHGAGVLADRRIENLSEEQFQSVFSTKVEGLRALLAATEKDPLSVICVFSSVAARCGNHGQAAYAMANECMNQVARKEAAVRAGKTKVKILDWGPWEGGMVTPALKRRFESLGVTPLSMREGALCFAEEMAGDEEVEVVLGDLPPMPSRELRVRVSAASHPFLTDHRIQGMPVLPVVEALELFLRCAIVQAEAPPGRWVCTDLKVLRGVLLDQFQGKGNLLLVRPCGKGVFELVSPGGVRHYEATLLPEALCGVAGHGHSLSALSCAPWNDNDFYGKLLFHGPAFQVIRHVGGVSHSGIQGTVTGIVERQWPQGFRCFDAALLDGGLQLARLWGFHSIGKLTLPAKIGHTQTSLAAISAGPFQCDVKGETIGNSGIRCDVTFRSPSGELVAAMTGVEMFASLSQ